MQARVYMWLAEHLVDNILQSTRDITTRERTTRRWHRVSAPAQFVQERGHEQKMKAFFSFKHSEWHQETNTMALLLKCQSPLPRKEGRGVNITEARNTVGFEGFSISKKTASFRFWWAVHSWDIREGKAMMTQWWLDVASQAVSGSAGKRESAPGRTLGAPWLAKDLFVGTCGALPFGDFKGMVWQDRKGEEVSEVLGTCKFYVWGKIEVPHGLGLQGRASYKAEGCLERLIHLCVVCVTTEVGGGKAPAESLIRSPR